MFFRLELSRDLSDRRFFHILSLFQASADLMNALHWLKAFKLSSFQVGLFGVISTLIGAYKSLKYKNLS